MTERAERPAPARDRSIIIVLALMLAEFTSAFELTMIYSTLKSLFVVFGDPKTVGWLITSYLLVAAAAAAICGKLGDMFGRRRVLLIVLAGAMTGSLISATATELQWIIVGRSIQGLAGAILPLCFGIARESLDQRKVAYGISALGSTAVISASMGTLIGGIIVDNIGWHAIFQFSAAFAALSMLAVFLAVPNRAPRNASARIDLIGGLLFVPAIWGILLAFSKGGEWGWTDAHTLLVGAAGMALLIVWIWHELRTPEPLVNLRMLSRRELLLANLAMFFYGMGPVQGQLHMVLMQQPAWTGIGLGLTATIAGLYVMPGQIASLAAAPVTALACEKLGARGSLVVAALFLVGSAALVVFVPAQLWSLVLAGPLTMLGTVILFSAAPNLVVAATPSANTAESTGVLQVSRSMGQAIGSMVIAVLSGTSTVTSAAYPGVFPAPAALMLALCFVLTMSLCVLLCALLQPGHPTRAQVTT